MRSIDVDELKNAKFLSPQVKVVGGRHGGKLKEQIIRAYQKGWNDCIDAIIDNAPTVPLPNEQIAWEQGYEAGLAQGKQDRLKGEWITVSRNCWKCPYCQELTNEGKNFCPNCGAKMGGGAE